MWPASPSNGISWIQAATSFHEVLAGNETRQEILCIFVISCTLYHMNAVPLNNSFQLLPTDTSNICGFALDTCRGHKIKVLGRNCLLSFHYIFSICYDTDRI
jgi:hypothetical protein